jgi:hypothetical protein
MGKKKNKIVTKYKSSVSLENQITKKSPKRKEQQEKFRDIVLRADSDDEGNEEFIDSKTSKRILRAVEKQRMEFQGITPGKVHKPLQVGGKAQGVRFQNVEMNSDEDSEPEYDDEGGDIDNEVDAFRESFKMSEEDERALALFQK